MNSVTRPTSARSEFTGFNFNYQIIYIKLLCQSIYLKIKYFYKKAEQNYKFL